MSDDTWSDGDASYDAEPGDGDASWIDGGPGLTGDPDELDTADLGLGEDETDPGAADSDDLDLSAGPDDDPMVPADDVDPDDALTGDDPVAEDQVDADGADTPWFAPETTEEPALGADPDHDELVDADWSHDAFPPELDLDDPPEPVDGLPWSDPAMLGDINDGVIDTDQAEYSAPDVADLLDYSGAQTPAEGADVWAELLSSEDPATSGLARWWAPSR